MKSAPPAIASSDARRTLSYVPSSPVSRITLRCASPHASLTWTISSYDLRVAAGEERAAVDHHVDLVRAEPRPTARTSASFTSSGDWPDGKAVATDATFTLDPAQPLPRGRHEVRVDADAPRPTGSSASVGSGRTAFDAERSDLARRVGALERRQIHHPDRELEREELRLRLIERFASVAARSSSATASTEPIRGSRGLEREARIRRRVQVPSPSSECSPVEPAHWDRRLERPLRPRRPVACEARYRARSRERAPRRAQ